MTNKKGISIEELNQAYMYLNKEFKIQGYPIKDEISLIIESKDKEELTLKFKQEDIGLKGSYVFISKDLYVIGVEQP